MNAVALALSALLAAAPPVPEAAKRLYESGSSHFRAGRYDAAAADFEKAYNAYNKPGLLHNQALALEKAGRLVDALVIVSRFEAVGSAREAKGATRWRLDLEKRLMKTHARVTMDVWPAHAELLVNGAVRSTGAAWLPAGTLTVSAVAMGYEAAQQSRTIAAGETVTVSLALRPSLRPLDGASARRPTRPADQYAPLAEVSADEPTSTGVILLGTGGGLVLVGAILHLAVALPLASALDGLDAGRPDYDAEFDRRADVVEGAMMGAWISYGLGAALGIAGGVMMGLEEAPAVEVQVGMDGVVRVGGRF